MKYLLKHFILLFNCFGCLAVVIRFIIAQYAYRLQEIDRQWLRTKYPENYYCMKLFGMIVYKEKLS